MNQAAAAELKTTLVGVALPAERPDLLEYAIRQHAEPTLLDALRSLPGEHAYESLDEVIEALLRVQPNRGGGVPQAPDEESGEPPGGDSYTT